MVIRMQGADPALIRQRKPRLVDLVEKAIIEGMQSIQPVAAYTILPVEEIGLESFTLVGIAWSVSPFVAQRLTGAQAIAAVVCTLGAGLEARISRLADNDPVYTFALDTFGSVAANCLRVAACDDIKASAWQNNLYTSMPLIPGLNGWSVEVSQPKIFSVVDTNSIGVTLNESAQMTPRKSISMVLGIGKFPFATEHPFPAG